jgi:cobalt/nickel transport system permease protein
MSRLEAALEALRDLDTLSARDTALSRRDPRAQLITTAAFIVTVVSFGRHEVAALLPLAAYPLVLAGQGQVSGRLLRQALWLGAPFALMVGIFNPWFDRAPVWALGGLAVAGGWFSLVSILLRMALTVSATVVLVAGTGMPALGAAMARLGVPTVLTVQLQFLYRYLFVLAGQAQRMATARQLRGGGARAMSLATYGSLLGHLLLRAFDQAQRVHQAMLARGYHGTLAPARGLHWRGSDTLFVAAWCAYFALARSVPLPHALGTALAGLLRTGGGAP